MSKKKITLEEAKKILNLDKVFYNGNNKFNVLDVGKYNSQITLEIPQEWVINEQGVPEDPISYMSVRELTDGMNLDFDGDASVMFGNHRISKKGGQVFEITAPTKAKDTLIRVDWGGAFTRSRGQSRDYAKEAEAKFFAKRSSNGGGMGYDYWILPVDYVKDREPRDVKSILENIEKKENERIAKIDKNIELEEKRKKDSIANRDRILKEIKPIVDEITKLEPNFAIIPGEEGVSGSYRERYTDDLVKSLNKHLVTLKEQKEKELLYRPMFENMEDVVSSLELKMEYSKTCVYINSGNMYPLSFNYSLEGYNSFVQHISKIKEELAEKEAEIRRKEEELKRELQMTKMKKEAKEKGYPENFTFWNRLGGATNLGHAYVVEKNGDIRYPDYNMLINQNHKRYNDWVSTADGTQLYDQVLPGEVIVTYTKECTAKPYIFDVAWADGEITGSQLDVLLEKMGEKASFADTSYGEEITDLKKWLVDAVKEKAIECRKTLNIEPEKSDEFVKEIVSLALEKEKAEIKEEKAKELKKEYENFEKNKNSQAIGED